MNRRGLLACCLWTALAVMQVFGPPLAADAHQSSSPSGQLNLEASSQTQQIATIDHAVPHTSTVPANAGQVIQLFVREVVASNSNARKAVLMIHSASVPVLAGFDLRTDQYSMATWLAQSGGFDVFMLDFQGSGRSPRPKMDDPCNVPTVQQRSILIPNPLSATCSPSYAYQLISSHSDLTELDTVVEYIRTLRRDPNLKVALVSWSQGSLRIGPYAVAHPAKVDSLLLIAPIYNPDGPDALPLDPATGQPVGLPQPGNPMMLRTRIGLMGATAWGREIKCQGQLEDGIQDAIWGAIMDNDPIGRTWGPPPVGAPLGSPPEGVMRVRSPTLNTSPSLGGWNSKTASRVEVPALIIYGEFDLTAPPMFDELYNAVPNPNKLLFKVQCAGHFLVWEKQSRVLHHISKQWLRHGRVEEFANGRFFVDKEGNLFSQ